MMAARLRGEATMMTVRLGGDDNDGNEAGCGDDDGGAAGMRALNDGGSDAGR